MEQHLDWNAKVVRFFVQNSRLVILLILAIALGGAVSLFSLRREGFPQIAPKIVLVQTVYPGASSNEVESQVTREIEASLKDVKDLKEISSTSQNSFSNVTITLEESANIDTASQDIQSKVQAVKNSLPEGVEQPKITTFNAGGPAFIIGITRPDTDSNAIREEAQTVANALSQVTGIKSAELMSEQGTRIVVAYRLQDLRRYGINLTTVSQILQAANVDLPVGTLDINNKEQSIISIGSFESIDTIKDLIVGVNPATGQPVKIQDIAEVKSASESNNFIDRFAYTKNNKLIAVTGSLINVTATENADIIQTREAVREEISQIKSEGEIASDVDAILLSDQAESTQEQVTEIVEAAFGAKRNFWLLGGIQLLFIAILLFVNVRAAFVAALSIPLSLGITFITLALLGIQLNTIVLFSLILVLGLIFDPAIVMVEAIQRYRDLKYPGREAVIESGRRYGASLFMAVLTSLIVFFPFGVVSGIFGEIIKYIPLTVIPALFASYFVPIALLPLLAERLLKQRKGAKNGDEHEGLSLPSQWVMGLNRWVLAKPWRHVVMLIIAFGFVAGSVALVPMGKVQIVQFSSPEDSPFLQVAADYKNGLTFTDRDSIAQKIETLILEEKGVKQLYYASQSRDSVTIFVELKDKANREDDSQKSKAIVARLRPELTKLDGLTDTGVDEVASGPPTAAFPIQTQLYSNNTEKLEKAAKEVGTFLAGVEHVTKVDDGFSDRGEPELRIELNRTKVQQSGLSSFEVGQQIKSLTDETEVSRFENKSTGQTEDIILVNSDFPKSITEIADLPIATRTGATVRLGDIANITEATTVDAIQRFNGSRFVNVRAKVDDPKNTLTVQQKLDEYLTDNKVKELGLESRQNRGEFEDIAQSFKELSIALVVAIGLTYLVLVLQFKSFSQPGIMLFTIPLSFIGVFPALWLTKSDLGFLELLGVTILVGIVENVAIFLIDYANQLMKEKNLSAREAIIQASGVRFRPIILTKLVALGGLLPLAIESDFWRGLSVVIIAGIGISGFFSLVIIPILYVWIGGLRDRVHRRHKKERVLDMPQDNLSIDKKVPAILR